MHLILRWGQRTLQHQACNHCHSERSGAKSRNPAATRSGSATGCLDFARHDGKILDRKPRRLFRRIRTKNTSATSRVGPASGWITFSLLTTAQPIRRNNARAKLAPKLLYTLKTKAKAKQLKPDSRIGLAPRMRRAADKIGKSRGWSFWILMVNIFPKRSIDFCWQQLR